MEHDTLWQEETTSLSRWAPTPVQIVDTLDNACLVHSKPPHPLGSPVKLTNAHVCLALVVALLKGMVSQADVWRLICSCKVGSFGEQKVCGQTVSNHLAMCAETMRRLFVRVSSELQDRQWWWRDRGLAPFATRVLVLDESTLDQVKRWLPDLRSLKKGSKALLAGRISALFDLRLQQWTRVDLLDEAVNDSREHAMQMITHLEAGCLLLFDAGYSKFLWFDALSRRQIHFIARLPLPVTSVVQCVLYQGPEVRDALVFLGQQRSDQCDFPVRLIEFWWHGTFHRYVTNVLNTELLSVHDIVELYARRWDIEMAFRLLKDYLKGATFWSAKWSVIQAQLWGLLLLAQILHAWQGEIARQAGVERFDVSMKLIVRALPDLLQQRVDPTDWVVRHGPDIGLIRPSARSHMHCPWIDPLWVTPVPPEACQPRAKPAYHAPEHPRPHKYRKTGACASACIEPHP